MELGWGCWQLVGVEVTKERRLTGEGWVLPQVVLVLELEVMQVTLLWPHCWRGSCCARMNLQGRRREVPLKWLLLHLFS